MCTDQEGYSTLSILGVGHILLYTTKQVMYLYWEPLICSDLISENYNYTDIITIKINNSNIHIIYIYI